MLCQFIRSVPTYFVISIFCAMHQIIIKKFLILKNNDDFFVFLVYKKKQQKASAPLSLEFRTSRKCGGRDEENFNIIFTLLTINLLCQNLAWKSLTTLRSANISGAINEANVWSMTTQSRYNHQRHRHHRNPCHHHHHHRHHRLSVLHERRDRRHHKHAPPTW